MKPYETAVSRSWASVTCSSRQIHGPAAKAVAYSTGADVRQTGISCRFGFWVPDEPNKNATFSELLQQLAIPSTSTAATNQLQQLLASRQLQQLVAKDRISLLMLHSRNLLDPLVQLLSNTDALTKHEALLLLLECCSYGSSGMVQLIESPGFMMALQSMVSSSPDAENVRLPSTSTVRASFSNIQWEGFLASSLMGVGPSHPSASSGGVGAAATTLLWRLSGSEETGPLILRRMPTIATTMLGRLKSSRKLPVCAAASGLLLNLAAYDSGIEGLILNDPDLLPVLTDLLTVSTSIMESPGGAEGSSTPLQAKSMIQGQAKSAGSPKDDETECQLMMHLNVAGLIGLLASSPSHAMKMVKEGSALPTALLHGLQASSTLPHQLGPAQQLRESCGTVLYNLFGHTFIAQAAAGVLNELLVMVSELESDEVHTLGSNHGLRKALVLVLARTTALCLPGKTPAHVEAIMKLSSKSLFGGSATPGAEDQASHQLAWLRAATKALHAIVALSRNEATAASVAASQNGDLLVCLKALTYQLLDGDLHKSSPDIMRLQVEAAGTLAHLSSFGQIRSFPTLMSALSPTTEQLIALSNALILPSVLSHPLAGARGTDVEHVSADKCYITSLLAAIALWGPLPHKELTHILTQTRGAIGAIISLMPDLSQPASATPSASSRPSPSPPPLPPTIEGNGILTRRGPRTLPSSLLVRVPSGSCTEDGGATQKRRHFDPANPHKGAQAKGFIAALQICKLVAGSSEDLACILASKTSVVPTMLSLLVGSPTASAMWIHTAYTESVWMGWLQRTALELLVNLVEKIDEERLDAEIIQEPNLMPSFIAALSNTEVDVQLSALVLLLSLAPSLAFRDKHLQGGNAAELVHLLMRCLRVVTANQIAALPGFLTKRVPPHMPQSVLPAAPLTALAAAALHCVLRTCPKYCTQFCMVPGAVERLLEALTQVNMEVHHFLQANEVQSDPSHPVAPHSPPPPAQRSDAQGLVLGIHCLKNLTAVVMALVDPSCEDGLKMVSQYHRSIELMCECVGHSQRAEEWCLGVLGSEGGDTSKPRQLRFVFDAPPTTTAAAAFSPPASRGVLAEPLSPWGPRASNLVLSPRGISAQGIRLLAQSSNPPSPGPPLPPPGLRLQDPLAPVSRGGSRTNQGGTPARKATRRRWHTEPTTSPRSPELRTAGSADQANIGWPASWGSGPPARIPHQLGVCSPLGGLCLVRKRLVDPGASRPLARNTPTGNFPSVPSAPRSPQCTSKKRSNYVPISRGIGVPPHSRGYGLPSV
eukprot:gene28884-32076_t